MYFIGSSFSEWSPIRQTGSDEIDTSARFVAIAKIQRTDARASAPGPLRPEPRWRGLAGPVRGSRPRGALVGRRTRPRPCRRGYVSPLPRGRRRPEHVLQPGLRALRRWALRFGG